MTGERISIEFIDGKPIGAVGERFNYDYHDEKIIDNQTGKTYDKNNYHMLVIDGLLNQLNNENEQLKCGNKNLKSTLNDFINILNRLQANPTDKQTIAVARDMLQNMGVDLE